jgi:5-methylcytosine-specific restriction endonuclease McrA
MTRNQRLRAKLLADDPCCRYCGVELTQRRATLDHVVPRSRGGSDAISNLRISCRFCNMAKAARLPGELLEWATRIVAAAGGI